MITTTTIAAALVRNIYIYIYIEFRSLQFKGLDFIIVVLLCQRKPNEHHYWEPSKALLSSCAKGNQMSTIIGNLQKHRIGGK